MIKATKVIYTTSFAVIMIKKKKKKKKNRGTPYQGLG